MWEGTLGELISQESAEVCVLDIVCIAHVGVHQTTPSQPFDG